MGVIAIIIGYLLGSIPTGIIVTKWMRGVDIRNFGSGSTGATNVLRTTGKKAAALVFSVDIIKGVLSIWIARDYLSVSPWWTGLAGLLAVIGHNFPIFSQFRGGKGVATALGIFTALFPISTLIGLIIWIICIAIWRYVSLGSIISAALIPALSLISTKPGPYLLFTCLISLLIIYRHKDNIKRLLKGQESKLGEKASS
ncbi:MAG: glycerol-3-phosphate 1-O-acyltransferase PlsY [Candidatus Tectomicrobia bacterium]|uniref:Glycerol-3-phosphate acyltransferase n=1 Tax=Tectimicrobiota bacterium TaxID=2528274 RepID=A0A933GN33_UNCTE|nr:glycerol-3-phosphate 1-O-acyltransferase PlsY [Candidatus Tectomicrobia bacterium]